MDKGRRKVSKILKAIGIVITLVALVIILFSSCNSTYGEDTSNYSYKIGYDKGFLDGQKEVMNNQSNSFITEKDLVFAYSDGYAAAEGEYTIIAEEQYALGCIDTMLEYGFVEDAAEYASSVGLWSDFLGELKFYDYYNEYDYYCNLGGMPP